MIFTPPAFAFANFVITSAMKIFTRWRVEGRANVPKQGPFIAIANHTHYLDPPLVSASLERRVLFLAKRELVTELTGYRRWCIVHYGLIPINRRGLDREALNNAMGVLGNKGIVGVFPEGTRSRTGELQPAIPGVALFTLPAKVPIVPVGISGLAGVRIGPKTLLRRPRVTVRIGPPFILPFEANTRDRATVIAATDFMMERLAALLPEGQRGSYKGHAASHGTTA